MGRDRFIRHGRFATSGALTAPVKTGNPIIIGTAQVGQTLTATHGTYTGTVTSYSGQWYSGASPIALATSLSYTIVSGDLGNNITYQESASNAAGSSATGTSNALGPVSGLLAPSYDTRFGTATDSGGWITFALRSGQVRVWLDSSRPDDSGDGLSAATAKKTFDAAFAVLAALGTGGNQLMIAGGSGGGSYTDNKTGNWSLNNGFSLAYPTAVLSYDRADAANIAKYGKLVSSQMPSITLATISSSFEMSTENSGAANYYFIQGIEFTAPNDGAGYAINWNFRHNGVGVQNCRFDKVGLGINNQGSALGQSTTIHVSKCSFDGQWTTSTAVGLYLGGLDGCYWEDNVFAHCGWKIVPGSVNTRGSTHANGDPNQFSHAFYYYASNINGRAQRILGIDSAHDSLNFRGGVDSNVCVTLDDPWAATMGGFSASYTEAPLGVDQHHVDHMYMGGADMSPVDSAGNGPYTTNTKSGSYLRKVAAFDNPSKAAGFNSHVLPHCDDVNQIDQYLTIDQFHAYNYAAGLETSGTTNNTKIHDSWTNGVVDVLTPISLNTTLTSTTTNSGAFPSAMTRDQVITALLTAVGVTPSGTSYLARKSQLVNLACWRPDLPWAQLLIDIGFPAYNLTPTYQAATIPNLAAESPRAVY